MTTRKGQAGDQDLVADSRFLAYVLRHNPATIGVRLDSSGWTEIGSLLDALAAHGRPMEPERLHSLVAGLDKQRFEIDNGKIRQRSLAHR